MSHQLKELSEHYSLISFSYRSHLFMQIAIFSNYCISITTGITILE